MGWHPRAIDPPRQDIALWSRGENAWTGASRNRTRVASLPGDAVLDGELLGWREGDAPVPFTELQTASSGAKPGPKILADTPARVLVYDLLERNGEDLREVRCRSDAAMLKRCSPRTTIRG